MLSQMFQHWLSWGPGQPPLFQTRLFSSVSSSVLRLKLAVQASMAPKRKRDHEETLRDALGQCRVRLKVLKQRARNHAQALRRLATIFPGKCRVACLLFCLCRCDPTCALDFLTAGANMPQADKQKRRRELDG